MSIIPEGMAETSNPRKVIRTGSSSAVTIPEKILDHADLEEGDRVVLVSDGDSVEIEPVQWRRTSEL